MVARRCTTDLLRLTKSDGYILNSPENISSTLAGHFKIIYNGGDNSLPSLAISHIAGSAVINLLSTCRVLSDTGDSSELGAPVTDVERSNLFPDNHPCHPFSDYDREKKQFFSPGFPAETYPNNTECVCIIEAQPGYTIRLDFRDTFEIEDSVGCKNDFLEVRDGAHGYNNVLYHPFCGSDFPPVISSTDRHLWIYFKSDETIECKGFRAVYEFIPRPQDKNTPPELIPCEKSIVNKDFAIFGSNDIPKDIMEYYLSTPDLHIDCVWNITVKENWKVYLQFEKFVLEKTNDCDSNFVDVFSGDTNMKSRLRNFCGSIADSVASNHNSMFVRFYSENKYNKSFFSANFTAFRQYEKGHGKCTSKEFDCEDNTCILADFKCDDKFNCRFRWDENECNTGKSLGFSQEHIVIIMVIFSLILAGMCFAFIFNCVRKLIRDHQTIQEYIRQSREQQLNELDKPEPDKNEDGRSRSIRSSLSLNSHPFDATNTAAPCYVPGGDLLPILHSEHSVSPHDSYNQNIYTVDYEGTPNMCDSACQTRESLLTNQGYSSEATTPDNSLRTNSPTEPFSTFGYKKDNKYKAEAKIHVGWKMDQGENRRPYSVQTTKSAPDVIVTH